MIFDVNMSFTIKALFVSGGHHAEPLTSATYESVLLKYSVCVAVLFAALNYVDVLIADIQSAYLNVLCKAKLWIRVRS